MCKKKLIQKHYCGYLRRINNAILLGRVSFLGKVEDLTFSVFSRDWFMMRVLSLSCLASTTISSVRPSWSFLWKEKETKCKLISKEIYHKPNSILVCSKSIITKPVFFNVCLCHSIELDSAWFIVQRTHLISSFFSVWCRPATQKISSAFIFFLNFKPLLRFNKHNPISNVTACLHSSWNTICHGPSSSLIMDNK